MHAGETDRTAWACGEYTIVPACRQLLRAGTPVDLEAKVFDLIVLLVENRDRAVGKQEVVAALWGHRPIADAALSQLLYKARRALDDARPAGAPHPRPAQALGRPGRPGRGRPAVALDRAAQLRSARTAETAYRLPAGGQRHRRPRAGLDHARPVRTDRQPARHEPRARRGRPARGGARLDVHAIARPRPRRAHALRHRRRRAGRWPPD